MFYRLLYYFCIHTYITLCIFTVVTRLDEQGFLCVKNTAEKSQVTMLR